jgi:putative flippase GtrA
VAYWVAAYPLSMGTVPSSVLAWVAAVLFAYVTNRKWVFRSQAVTRQEVTREIASFFGCRLATGVVDWAMMFVCVDLLRFNDMIIKIFANIVVIILNYVASKLLIFKNKNS